MPNSIFKLIKKTLFIAAACTMINIYSTAFADNQTGANLNFSEVKATDMSFSGNVKVLQKNGGNSNLDFIASEGIDKKSVLLNSGDSISYKVDQTYNAIVIRYCIPPDVSSSTLDVTVDGKEWATLNLTNKFSYVEGWEFHADAKGGVWGYDKPTTIDANTHHFFDEVRYLGSNIQPGQTITISAKNIATSDWVVIDLIDLSYIDRTPSISSTTFFEEPIDFISIADYAKNNHYDTSSPDFDWATIINACITAVNNKQYDGVWIPAGTYTVNSQINVSNVKIYGAGMWQTTLQRTIDQGFEVFTFTGGNNDLEHFSILGDTTNRNDPKQDNAFGGNPGDNTILDGIWMEHTKCGFWVIAGNNLTIKNCIIRDTYADGVNFCGGTTNSTVENCSIRNTGDDGLAMWSSTSEGNKAIDINNSFNGNTIQLPWRASCIALYGGESNTVENNYCHDSCVYPGLNISESFDPHPFAGTTTISNNTFQGCGGYWSSSNTWYGSINIMPYQGSIGGLNFKNTIIISPVYTGIYFDGFNNGNTINATFENTTFNNVDTNNSNGITVSSYARGSADFNDLILDGSNIDNQSSNFTISTNGSSSTINYDMGTRPSICINSDETQFGEVHQGINGDLWFDLLIPHSARLVNVKYDEGANPSICYISSGDNAGNFAEVHEDPDNNTLWFDIIKPDGTRIVNVQYDIGSVPSIAFISSGIYSGYIAEAHSDPDTNTLWYDILSQDGKRLVNIPYDKGMNPSIVFLPNDCGYIVEAHESQNDNHLWFDIIDLSTQSVTVNKRYDTGYLPKITYIPSGKYAGMIGEVHDSGSNVMWSDTLDLKGNESNNIKRVSNMSNPSVVFWSNLLISPYKDNNSNDLDMCFFDPES